MTDDDGSRTQFVVPAEVGVSHDIGTGRGTITYAIGYWVAEGRPVVCGRYACENGFFCAVHEMQPSGEDVSVFATGPRVGGGEKLIDLLARKKYSFRDSDHVRTLNVAASTYGGKIDFGDGEPTNKNRLIIYPPFGQEAIEFIRWFKESMQKRQV
jgi:hypothetical protein